MFVICLHASWKVGNYLSLDASGATTLIVDDQPDLLELLRDVANDVDSLQVVGEARDGHQAVELAKRLKPDVVLLDLHTPRMPGLEAIPHLLRIVPKAVILVVTMETHPRRGSRRIVSAGARPRF